MRCKFIFVTGGVLSSLGKGVSASALGALLKARGLKVTILKMDPYINVDPGTMSPYQHGEVYVTEDGAETDLDLGHYERFTGEVMHQANNFTTGGVYQSVIERERAGDYLGRTVQVIPHITDEIKRRIYAVAEGKDVMIIEVGGTVGDIEGLPFLESVRQVKQEQGASNVMIVHVTLVPYIKTAGELKTKPTQHSVKGLLQLGIQPDMLFCRSDRFLPQEIKQKIARFCNLEDRDVIAAEDVASIYELPLKLWKEGVDDRICERLGIWAGRAQMDEWVEFVSRTKSASRPARIGIVGKYVHLTESYKSLNEALQHGGVAQDIKVELVFINSEESDKLSEMLGEVDGLLVPGGFGERGTEGKIRAIKYARENGLPFFGICLGMQLAVVEYARGVAKLTGAMSREFDAQTTHPVIELMDAQRKVTAKGGTMRLGGYPCVLTKGSRANAIYGKEEISERHRHRYEFNPDYKERLEEAGLVFSGWSPDGKLAEVVEISDHPWFVAVQYHPEFLARPLVPHPLFMAFVKAAAERAESS
jgi:CTP synthase